MAKLKGPLAFTGKLQGFSAYTRIGTEGVILRQSTGPSKHDIETKPSFANTRRNNKEFGGRSTASKLIRDGHHPLKPVSDLTDLARLNALLKPIQEMDTQSEYGKRSVALSLNRQLLEGFPLNEKHPFESVVRNPVDIDLSREELKAIVTLPALLSSVNFYPPTRHPFFRVIATLSIVPDLVYNEKKYRPLENYDSFRPEAVMTAWMAVTAGSESISMELQMPVAPPDDQFSLVLAIGIEMGTAQSTALIKGVKYAGTGKIAKVG
ncbi:MAG TPA: hypothetical protein VJ499_08140 [Flavisolibacter sp.]|nr:hypothetical protein [Flavisolibacter sp.]